MKKMMDARKVVVYLDPDRYTYEPCVVALNDNDLIVVFTEGRERFHSDFDSISLIRSADGGQTWEPDTKKVLWACTDLTGATDPAISRLADGTLIAHFSTSLSTGKKGILEDMGPQSENLQGMRQVEGIDILRSVDQGRTWSDPYRANIQPLRTGYATDGILELSDGVLLMPTQGKLWMPGMGSSSPAEPTRCYLLRSDDKGANWEHFSTIAFDAASIVSFIEPGMARTSHGRLVCLMRTFHAPRRRHQHLWLAYSDNDGESWSRPEATEIWGYPADLITLDDGRILATYGYRRQPWGLRGCLSEDGVSWDLENEFIICEGGEGPDKENTPYYHIGYPVSIQAADGSIFTVHHEWTQNDPSVQYITGYRFQLPD